MGKIEYRDVVGHLAWMRHGLEKRRGIKMERGVGAKSMCRMRRDVSVAHEYHSIGAIPFDLAPATVAYTIA
jgi:hypothetical protein